MKFFRNHWYDIGGFFSIILLTYIFACLSNLTNYQLIVWFSLVSLFFHQLEEYRIAGTFPGMINTVIFKSVLPDRYPLNTNTSLVINVLIGWLVYFLAALFAEKAVWLGIASILISFGNLLAHTFLFNLKGKTWYNAGLITCWLFFAPVIYYFFSIIITNNLATRNDYLIGIILGIILNTAGVFGTIRLMADKNTAYIFPARNLLQKFRNHQEIIQTRTIDV